MVVRRYLSPLIIEVLFTANVGSRLRKPFVQDVIKVDGVRFLVMTEVERVYDYKTLVSV